MVHFAASVPARHRWTSVNSTALSARKAGWPEVTPTVWFPNGDRLRLRPLLRSDGARWAALRLADEEYLRPVEPTTTSTWQRSHSPSERRVFASMLRRQAAVGEIAPFAIELNGEFVGQFTVGGIQNGTMNQCWIGYWVAHSYTGRGIATVACALGTQHAFDRLGVHRVTATYLPENQASATVLAKNRFSYEGVLRKAIHIDGQWRDHVQVSLVANDFLDLPVTHLIEQGHIRPSEQDAHLFGATPW